MHRRAYTCLMATTTTTKIKVAVFAATSVRATCTQTRICTCVCICVCLPPFVALAWPLTHTHTYVYVHSTAERLLRNLVWHVCQHFNWLLCYIAMQQQQQQLLQKKNMWKNILLHFFPRTTISMPLCTLLLVVIAMCESVWKCVCMYIWMCNHFV